jgi:hypothetical protein
MNSVCWKWLLLKITIFSLWELEEGAKKLHNLTVPYDYRRTGGGGGEA